MNVFFDVDYTILGFDGSLRPHTLEVFERLVADGHTVYVWSGVGVRSGEVRRAGLEPLVTGVYQKPLSRYTEGLALLGVPVVPDFVIDDYPGIVEHFGGLCIKPYVGTRWPDDELLAIPGLVGALILDEPPEEACEVG